MSRINTILLLSDSLQFFWVLFANVISQLLYSNYLSLESSSGATKFFVSSLFYLFNVTLFIYLS